MSIANFIRSDESQESYWRGLILFGRNSASYKFALAKSLIELNPSGGQLLRLEEIAPIYAKNLVEHLRHSPKQITRRTSPFIDALKLYGIESPDEKRLIEETVKRGFVDVIRAFQVVSQSPIEKPFYIDEVRSHGGIRVTDNFSRLMERPQSSNLMTEIESRGA